MPKDPRPDRQLFQGEQTALERARALEELAKEEGGPLGEGFLELLEAFHRLYRQSNLMVKTNDRNQAQLRSTQDQLQDELTYRAEVERQLRLNQTALTEAKEVAEQALSDKARFFASMSHELRTPLSGVITTAKLLAHTPLNPTQGDYLDTIVSSGKLLMAVIDDLLDFQRLEAGSVTLETLPCDLGELLEDCLDLLGAQAAQKGLELICHADRLPLVLCDSHRVQQVLVNLIGNAVKFTDSGEVEAGCRQAGDEVLFWVADSGPGIAKQRQQGLFSPFSQADLSTTRKYGGTGLGLSICKSLVDLFGGKIWLESDIGRGSCFYFTLPFRPQGEAPEPLPLLAGKRFILALAHQRFKTQVCRWIEAHGGQCRCTTEGRVALRWLGEETEGAVDALLADRFLPDIEGTSLIGRLKSRGIQIPLVLFNPKGQVLGPERGSAEVVSKPIRQVALLSALSELHLNQAKEIPAAEAPHLATKFPFTPLVADDNQLNQKLAIATLELMGYQAAGAENGVEVMEQLTLNEFDLILMDMEMPEMDGLQTSQMIKGAWPGQHKPLIIGLSANATEADRQLCFEHGMDDFLAKPLQPEALAERLEHWGQKLKSDPKWRFVAQGQAEEPEPPILEPEILSQLRRRHRPELVQSLIDDFTDDLHSAADELPPLLDQPEALRQAVHKYKGACLGLGAQAAAAKLRAIETELIEGDRSRLKGLLAEFIELKGPTLLEVKAQLERPSD